MMKKRFSVLGVLLICAVTIAVGGRKDEVTLVLVPREDNVVRVGMDIANHYRTLLISYKILPGGKVSLHGWSGKEWLNVKPADFKNGTFFRTGPDSALIIEKAGAPVPADLIPAEAWCDSVYKITTTELRPMLHLAGQYFDFPYKRWKWFAENYKFKIDDINPEGLNMAWYHKRFGDHLKGTGNAGLNDLKYWVAVRYPAPPVEVEIEEPDLLVPVEEEPDEHTDEAEEALPEMETPEDPDVNPLEGDAPEAVVLGAGEADEASAEKKLKEE